MRRTNREARVDAAVYPAPLKNGRDQCGNGLTGRWDPLRNSASKPVGGAVNAYTNTVYS